MLLSIAVVSTDASERYGKQLLSHLGHKVQMEPLPDRPAPAGRLLFAYGVGTVLPMPGQLILRATAANQESLARVQDVLQRHLEKFGARRELTVSWGPVESAADDEAASTRASGTPTAAETAAAQSGETSDLAASLDPDRAQQS
jgi:hypothetical protein